MLHLTALLGSLRMACIRANAYHHTVCMPGLIWVKSRCAQIATEIPTPGQSTSASCVIVVLAIVHVWSQWYAVRNATSKGAKRPDQKGDSSYHYWLVMSRSQFTAHTFINFSQEECSAIIGCDATHCCRRWCKFVTYRNYFYLQNLKPFLKVETYNT